MNQLLNLFAKLGNKAGNHGHSLPVCQPRAVIQQAIENVVDGTEPRIRLVSGYQKKLQEAVSTSLTYIDNLVEAIPAPIEVSRRTFIIDPQVNAYFVSVDDLQSTFSQSQELNAFFGDVENSHQHEAYAMLCMNMTEKRVMGVEVNGDMIRRDVMQTAVNFSGHKIMSPAASEAGIRQALKQCIFDGLITYALQGITSLKTQKNDLQDQRRILHAKLRHRLSQGTGMNALLASAYADQAEVAEVEVQLADAEKQLSEMPVNRDAPLGYLNEVKSILAHPETFLKLEIVTMKLTRMGIKVSGESTEACYTIRFAKLDIANVLKRVVAIVRYPRDEMQP